MTTSTHTAEFTDSVCLAYGRQVQELLNAGSPSEMLDHLWSIYSDAMAFQQEAGYNPRVSDIFMTFRELIFFMQRIESVKA
ncbi:hypothetical protein [Dyadobacter fermentans]|uniref:Uncharacterized protein n=1 Tax=Dyadobacter fermentans (strain ATCC 700827 / DSM 18053 / CIP 107007 / KCTC 52180 / NS114) TaxID=471854 RepID=C6W043_DYAFD|nr:hypothetical protein [Dyadobacter fermentans]ACT95370.1 hypothetical protein Dfer_4167 [Dyadobacter fermentans DSM 18053]